MNTHIHHQESLCRIRSRAIARRRGVTVLEVMFATGIAIAGMLGIGSLLLVAGRQASESNRSLESQTLAQDWYNEFVTRGMDNPASWVWYQDYQFPSNATGVPGRRAFSKRMYPGPYNVGRLTHSGAPATNQLLRPLGKMSVCVDPYFYSDRFIRSSMGGFNPEATSTWYRPAVFPFYRETFNPMTDSEFHIGTTGGLAWADQPRMLRVSLGQPGSILNEKQVESMFASTNELTMFASEDDRSLPSSRGYVTLPIDNGGSTTLVPFKASTQPHYSWMATLSPLEESNGSREDYYTLSLAVLYQRDRLFVSPAFPERVSAQPRPDDKPQGERVTWCVPLSGDFVGGSGGRVRLIASTGTDSSVSVGDWIMLSKHVSGFQRSNGTAQNVEAYSVFRWYRVVATDQEPAELPFYTSDPNDLDSLTGTGLTTDPYFNASFSDNVWARDIVLDGADWSFSAGVYPVVALDGTVTQQPAPTTATIVKGVVAIHERVVEIPDIGDF
ncbi:MAG: hypothetical protein Aurels2KO_07300 [Aureliella sp.]